MNIAICDDNREFVNAMEQVILQFSKTRQVPIEVDGFVDGATLLKAIEQYDENYDLIFLDIELGNYSGVDVGKRLRRNIRYEAIQLVFVSAKENYAMQLFDLRPMNFLVKPIQAERVIYILEEYGRLYDFLPHFVEFGKGGSRVRIEERSIIYLQSMAKRIQIVTTDRTLYVYGKLSDLSLQLNAHTFCAVHKSYVVNLRYVAMFGKTQVHMVNGVDIPVSRSMKENLSRMLVENGV